VEPAHAARWQLAPHHEEAGEPRGDAGRVVTGGAQPQPLCRAALCRHGAFRVRRGRPTLFCRSGWGWVMVRVRVRVRVRVTARVRVGVRVRVRIRVGVGVRASRAARQWPWRRQQRPTTRRRRRTAAEQARPASGGAPNSRTEMPASRASLAKCAAQPTRATRAAASRRQPSSVTSGPQDPCSALREAGDLSSCLSSHDAIL